MAFGNGTNYVERRKTSHINDNFREFLKGEVSRVLGIKVSERQAMTMFKVLMKSPLRFLVTLDKEDYDQNGERALAVTGVGKFKISDTVAQGKRLKLVGEGNAYPRYKFYPSAIVEHEVEILNGLESEEGRTVYDRTIKSEEYNIDLSIKEMAKLISNDPQVTVPVNPSMDFAEVFKGMVQVMVQDSVKDLLPTNVSKEQEPKEVDTFEDTLDEEETTELEPIEEDVEEETSDNVTDATVVADAIDDLDFDFDS